MKGTLYSSDFVKNADGDFKLLELNTDTDFPSASLEHFDWSGFNTMLTNNSISEVVIVHKAFQRGLVNNISESLHGNSSITTYSEQLEGIDAIYPTDVTDTDTKFILRLAYNEAALFDSEYCKKTISLFKLFGTDSEASSEMVVPHYVSASGDLNYVGDTLSRTFNVNDIPDVSIKEGTFSSGVGIDFFKVGKSSLSAADRYAEFITAEYNDGDLITNYVDTSGGGTHMISYRTCNIIYDTTLEYLNIASYQIPSWVDLPDSIEYDDALISNKLDNKHRYEFATNWPKQNYRTLGGVHGDSTLIDLDNNSVLAKNTVSGSAYKSLNIVGLPDTDDFDAFIAWSHAGNELPAGTAMTSSLLISNQSSSIDYGVISEVSSSDNTSISIGNSLPMLVYDINEDKVRFEYVYNLLPSEHKLFDSTGSLVDIVENNLVILDGVDYTYELNMESDDTFILNNSGVLLVAHNNGHFGYTCFLAGTSISLSNGDYKNIEDIQVGESVYSWDSETNSLVSSDVSKIDHRHTVGDHTDSCLSYGESTCGVFSLHSSDGTDLGLKFTPEHPFLTKRGWASLTPLEAQEPWKSQQAEQLILEVGDSIRTESGEWITIGEITFEAMDASTPVYNFTVPTHSNYIANNLVAHNK